MGLIEILPVPTSLMGERKMQLFRNRTPQPHTATAENVVVHPKTPNKRLSKPGNSWLAANNLVLPDENICQRCFAKHGRPEDVKSNSVWVSCGLKGCTFWCHAKCLHMNYTDKHTKEMDKWAKKGSDVHVSSPERRKKRIRRNAPAELF